MGETIPQLDMLCYQIQPPVPQMGYILQNHLLKGSCGHTQILQAMDNSRADE